MTHDRIGSVVLLIVAGWFGVLAYRLPPLDIAVPWRADTIALAVGVLALALFPEHLQLTGTVLAFSVLGIAMHMMVFDRDVFGWQILILTGMIALGIWFRRARLDFKDVVAVAALVAAGVAFAQPNVMMFAWMVIAVVNSLILLMKLIGSRRHSRS